MHLLGIEPRLWAYKTHVLKPLYYRGFMKYIKKNFELIKVNKNFL